MLHKNRFYVYVHLVRESFEEEGVRYDKGTVVYVGSGQRTRLLNKHKRSKVHIRHWDKLEKIILIDNLDENEKIEQEQQVIDHFVRFGYLFNTREKVKTAKPILYNEMSKYFVLDAKSFSYLTWIGSCKKTQNGRPAGCLKKNGYITVRIFGNDFKVHRIVWVLHNKQDLSPKLLIDHVDRNPSNNKPENLRAVSVSENNLNKNQNCNNSTGIRGVSYKKDRDRYETSAIINGKHVSKSYSPSFLRKNDTSLSEEKSHELALKLCLDWRKEILLQYFNTQI